MGGFTTIYNNRLQVDRCMPQTVLAIGAHNDDHIIGAGGTLIKYAKEGKKVKTVIFSYGEVSHPHLKPEVIVARRIKEAEAANEIMGTSGITWLGAFERSFDDDVVRLKLSKKLKDLIRADPPSKIFTHAPDDPHPYHRAVHHIVMDVVKQLKMRVDVYSFEVWNLLTLKNRDKPKLVVDISDSFKKKIVAFKAHESQSTTIFFLLGKVYLKDFTNGWNNNCRFAEVFQKLA